MNTLLAIPRIFVGYFQLFRAHTGRGIYLLIVLNAIMSWVEGIGIAMFLPLFSHGNTSNDEVSSSLSGLFRTLHVPPTPTGALPFIVAAFVLKGIFVFLTYAYQGSLTARIPRSLRREVLKRLRALDYRAIIGANAGFHSNLLVAEVNRVGSAFLHFVRTIPPALNVIVFLSIAFLLDWRMTLVCGAMGLVAVGILRFTGRVALQFSRVTTKESGGLSSLLIQMIQAFKYLRATAGFAAFEERIEVSAERLAHAEYQTGVAGAITQSASQPLMVLFFAALIYYRAGIRGEELSSLFVLLIYFVRIMTDLWTAQYSWQCLISYQGAVELVQSTLTELQRNVEARGTTPYVGIQNSIALDGVGFSYTMDRETLRDVTLTIPQKAMVAFVGDSGSGKSTLVDLITGTLKPTTGKITIDGAPLSAIDLEMLRAHIGYVPQDAMLFDDTVANNISLWKPATGDQIREAARQANCLDFIEAAPGGLTAHIGDRGMKLSGGQRQRLAIARELFKQPDLLVLDEATSALDSESERAIQQSIDALKGKMTILIIAHRLSTIRNCDYVCVLHDGQIVEAGTFQELVSRSGSRFQRMCELQKLTFDEAPSKRVGG